ncbi:integrase, catalytic region, zinc finger, CCHC-type containing protein [Tanacetum coccineum]
MLEERRIIRSEKERLAVRRLSKVRILLELVEIIIFIIDSGCSKHMTGNLKLLRNVAIKRVYYVEGLNHNLFSVGQFCDVDLEVAFRKSTCYICDLKRNDLRGTYLYSITLQDTSTPNLICLMAKASSLHACSSNSSKIIFVLLVSWEKQNNRTLVEAAQTMLNAAKVPLFFWAKAIATTCFTQNRSLVIPRHEKTPYHIINGLKPSVKFFYIFDSLCYIVKDGENFDKMKEKGDACIIVGQENVPQAAKTIITSNELDPLFSLMFDELLNGTTLVVLKSSAVTVSNTPDQRQQHSTTTSTSTTVAADTPPLNIQTTLETISQAPTVIATENINQAET